MDKFWVLQSIFNINIRKDIFEILEEMTHVEGNCNAAVRFCDGAMLCSFFLYIASFSNCSGKSFSCISITGPNWVQLLKLNHATFVDMMGWWDTLSGRGITYKSMSPVTKLENLFGFPFYSYKWISPLVISGFFFWLRSTPNSGNCLHGLRELLQKPYGSNFHAHDVILPFSCMHFLALHFPCLKLCISEKGSSCIQLH